MNGFQCVTPGAQNKSDIWITPKYLIDALGPFDLDPCGFLKEDGKPIVETAKEYFTEKDNGLIKDWGYGKMVFVNPPYSDLKSWMDKCAEESTKNSIIVLCFARTETKAWQQNVKYAYGINLINKRIKFINSEGLLKTNGNAPSALIAYGEDAYRRIKKVDGLCFILDK